MTAVIRLVAGMVSAKAGRAALASVATKVTVHQTTMAGGGLASFSEDRDGELYLVDLAGARVVRRLVRVEHQHVVGLRGVGSAGAERVLEFRFAELAVAVGVLLGERIIGKSVGVDVFFGRAVVVLTITDVFAFIGTAFGDAAVDVPVEAVGDTVVVDIWIDDVWNPVAIEIGNEPNYDAAIAALS